MPWCSRFYTFWRFASFSPQTFLRAYLCWYHPLTQYLHCRCPFYHSWPLDEFCVFNSSCPPQTWLDAVSSPVFCTWILILQSVLMNRAIIFDIKYGQLADNRIMEINTGIKYKTKQVNILNILKIVNYKCHVFALQWI